MNLQPQITADDLVELLKFISNNHYKPKDSDKQTEKIEDTCIRLISKDYPNLVIIPNENGELSTSYPSRIIVPEIETDDVELANGTNVLINNNNGNNSPQNITDNHRLEGNDENKKLDANKLKDLLSKARVARCRARFPIPVILYKNKYICRSATLSSGAEIYGRSVLDSFNDKNNSNVCTEVDYVRTNEDEDFAYIDDSSISHSLNISDSSKLFSQVRNQDIKLLKCFKVKLICDLMLEKKKVKYGMNVTSSEKADKKNRYNEFNIISLPYPGCEFFREYRDNSYSGNGLIYNWNQDFVDAKLDLPDCSDISKILNINFEEYRTWDVIKLTKNYLKLLLYYLKEKDSSILVHCISGWDRTPLFVSLLRIFLWAEGEIHRSLNSVELAYLTVAYDWFLFGHNLNDRLNKGEEIMFFCFQFLKFISEDFKFNGDLIQTVDNIKRAHSARKISTDSYSASCDFIIENISNYKGSSTSINSNDSSQIFVSLQDNIENRNEDLFPSDLDIKNNFYSITTITEDEIDMNGKISPQTEMISTLTDENNLELTKNSSSNLSPKENEIHFHSLTQPVEIPNSKSQTSPTANSGSLCGSDGWQFVSEAGSIKENHSNQFSSPESFRSFNRNSLSPSVNDKEKSIKRNERLNEVRKLFNSAYTSINFKYSNGCRFSNFVQFCRAYNISN